MALAVEVAGVSKSFRRYRPDRPYMLQEVLARGVRGFRASEAFWALKDVSFSVGRGKAVGIIGTNGSGKSTLLRLVGGIGRPDTGRIAVTGRIGALLDLGSGFHPDLSGRENVIIGGVLAGLTRQEVLRRFDAIVEFSGVAPFIDNPLRTYSSGMHMRLAFSTAVHTDPDVLIIDEVLAVGDSAFQRKCLARISSFKERGCSLLLVSHGMGVVQEMCDEVLWLDNGTLMAHGTVPEVVRQYTLFARRGAQTAATAGSAAPAASHRPVTHSPVAIIRSRLVDRDDRPIELLDTGNPMCIAVDYDGSAPTPLFRIRLTRDDGLVCFDIRTERAVQPPRLNGLRTIVLTLDRVDLNSGRYTIDVWAYGQDWIRVDDHRTLPLMVLGDGLREAALNTPHRWDARTAAPARSAAHGEELLR